MNTLERLKFIDLQWNDKDGTIEMLDDQAETNKSRVIAEMHDRDYGEAMVQAIECFPGLLYCLEELLEHIEWRRINAGEKAGAKDCTHRARAAIQKAKA